LTLTTQKQVLFERQAKTMLRILWIIAMPIIAAAIIAIGGQIGDANGYIVGASLSLGAIIAFLIGPCYLNQEIGTDEVGHIKEGGKIVRRGLRSGRHFVMFGIQALVTYPRWIQGEFNPEPEQTTGNRPHVYTAKLSEVLFPGKAKPDGKPSDNLLERRIAAKPDVGLSLEVVDSAELAEKAGTLEVAMDFLCEPIGQYLQEQAEAKKTILVALESLPTIQTGLQGHLRLHEEITRLGLSLRTLAIEELGLPEDLEAKLNEAAGKAAEREGRMTLAEAAGAEEKAIQNARSTGFKARVAGMIAKGVSPDVAAQVAASEAQSQALRENASIETLVMGGPSGINLNLAPSSKKNAGSNNPKKGPRK
jgi:hypothetical protein